MRSPREMPKTVCMDFDGVICRTRRYVYAEINDDPIPGAKEAIEKIRTVATVLVHSCRCADDADRTAVINWLLDNEIEVDGVVRDKPPADIYIDDRAITFTGDWSTVYDQVVTFRQWQGKR